MFSVCTTIYGDYPELAKKLLSSINHFDHIHDIRIGLNDASSETVDFVHDWSTNICHSVPVLLFQEQDGKNVGKYPLMRQMFKYRELADRVMWFDDDSYLDPAAGGHWWNAVDEVSQYATQIGALHSIRQRGKQWLHIQEQPWFTGKTVGPKHKYKFATGGWWVIKSEFITQWDYPFAELYHNGGDSMLGELLRQQGKAIKSPSTLMRCHCESCEKRVNPEANPAVVHINVGGRKGRRGIGVTDEKYVWATEPDLSHQNFNLKVISYGI